jgi:hypothetical protein
MEAEVAKIEFLHRILTNKVKEAITKCPRALILQHILVELFQRLLLFRSQYPIHKTNQSIKVCLNLKCKYTKTGQK